jgi:hypothetical protein
MNDLMYSLYTEAVNQTIAEQKGLEFAVGKFSELIIQECAKWLGNREFASPEALKQHFGVK